MSTRYRDGGATVTLTGDLAAWAETAIRAAAGDAVDLVRAELQAVADAAEVAWYGANGVTRRTGQSGQMEVVTTIDAGRGLIRVSVGSTDTRTVGARSTPVSVLVHRPGGKRGKGTGRAQPGSKPSDAIAKERRLAAEKSKAGDGKTILPIFVFKPGKVAIAASLPRLAALMAAKMSATNA